MKNNIKELFAAIGLIIVLVILMDPMHFYYSNMTLATFITLLIILYTFFVVFVLRDKPADEREELHQRLAGRVAFMAGTGVMLIGVVVQSFTTGVDVWLVAALTAMILAKVFAAKYGQRNF